MDGTEEARIMNKIIAEVIKQTFEGAAMSWEYVATECRDMYCFILGDDTVSRVWVDSSAMVDGSVNKEMLMREITKFFAHEIRDKIIGHTGNDRKNHIRLNVEQKVRCV